MFNLMLGYDFLNESRLFVDVLKYKIQKSEIIAVSLKYNIF